MEKQQTSFQKKYEHLLREAGSGSKQGDDTKDNENPTLDLVMDELQEILTELPPSPAPKEDGKY